MVQKLGIISLSTKKSTSSTLQVQPYWRTYWSFSWYASYHVGTWWKDAALVLEDADLEHAAKQIVAGAFATQDNVARPLNVIVLESVADKLATLLQEEVSKLTVGDPFDNAGYYTCY